MEQTPWNGLNVISDEINENRRTFENLNRQAQEGKREEKRYPKGRVPFSDDYDFVRYQDRIVKNEELRGLKNPMLAKGIIAMGIAFTLVLGGSCAGKVIAEKFTNLFKGDSLEQPHGTIYPSKEAYEAGLTPEQNQEMQRQTIEAERIYDEIASGDKQELMEEDLNAIKAFPENEYANIEFPQADFTEVNTFSGAKAM